MLAVLYVISIVCKYIYICNVFLEQWFCHNPVLTGFGSTAKKGLKDWLQTVLQANTPHDSMLNSSAARNCLRM